MAAVVAASDASPAVTPAQAAALVEEASGAFQRCRHVVPPNWASYMKIDQAMASSQRANIQAHVAASPDRWQHGILSRQQPEVRRRADRVLARHDGGQPTCDACGLPSVALKRCSRCKSTRYVRRGVGERASCAQEKREMPFQLRALPRRGHAWDSCPTSHLPPAILNFCRCSPAAPLGQCSTDCQARHWKSGHKQVGGGAATAASRPSGPQTQQPTHGGRACRRRVVA